MSEKLSHPEINIRITKLLEEYVLGQKDNRRLKLLRDLFSDKTETPLITAAKSLFPDKELNDALEDFRKFRDRLKKVAQTAKVSLELQPENPRADLNERRVIVKGEVSLRDKLLEKLDKSSLFKDLEKNMDYLPDKYQVPSLSLPLRTIIYPAEIDRFFRENFSEPWQDLNEEAKQFITNLSLKLEPFTRVFPPEPASMTMGFETLGISGNGDSFFATLKKCKELHIPEELPRITFFILSLCASQDLRRWWTRQGAEGANALIFTINLDNELLSSRFLSPEIFRRYMSSKDNLLFEVNEGLHEDKIRRVIELCQTYQFKVALDDSAEMSDRVRLALGGYAKLVKISMKTSQKLLSSRSEAPPAATIAELAKYRQEGKPFVIEGLEDEEWIEFLKTNWKKEYGELYVQGYAVRCGRKFTKFLMPPEESGIKGAYLIRDIPGQPIIPDHLPDKISRDKRRRLEEEMGKALRADLLTEDYQPPKYIPATIKTDSGDTDAIAFLEKWLTGSSQSPFFAVLGDLGMGKTFLGRMFTRHLLERIKQGEALPLPLYLDLRFLDLPVARSMPSLEEMIEDTLKGQGIPGTKGKDVLELVHSGEVLLIIDSIDEKTVGFTPERALHFWQQIRRGVTLKEEGKEKKERFSDKVILACRTHYFRDMEDVDSQLSEARRAGFRREDFQIAFLNSFTQEQILAYLKICFGDRAEELWNTLKGIYNLPDLAKRPFLLSLIEEHIQEIIDLKEKGVDITSASLYELTIKEWIRRDYDRHKIPGNMKAECMENLASNLWKKQAQTEHIDKIDEWVEENISPKFPGLPLDDRKQFKNDLRTATFLAWSEKEDERGRGVFRFQHRSFHEFFIARRIARALSQANPEPLNIPKISNEIAEFVLGLLNTTEYDLSGARETIERILEDTYCPEVSENALILLLKWRDSFPDSSPLPQRFCLSGAGLSGFIFKSLGLRNSLFERAELEDARFIDCDLSHSSFQGAKMSRARFINTRLHSINADRTVCPGSVWEKAISENPSFCQADLTSSVFLNSELPEADFESADLRFAAFTLTDLNGSKFNSSLLAHTGFAKCNLKDISCSDDWFKDSVLIMPEQGSPLPASHQLNDLSPRVFKGHAGSVTSVAVSKEAGLIASGSGDKTIKLWEIKTGRLLNTLQGHEDTVNSVAISQEAGLIASGSWDNTIKLWEIKTGRLLNTLQGHESSVNSVAISQEAGLIASGSDDKTVKVWEIKTGRLLNALQGHKSYVKSVAISKGAGIIASGSEDNTIKLWEIKTGRLLNTLQGHKNSVSSVAISKEAGIIASGSWDNTIKLWEIKTGRLLNTLQGHGFPVSSVAISKEAGLIASGSWDMTVKVWEIETGRLLNTLQGHEYPVTFVAISKEAGIIASGSNDNTVKVWEIETGQLLNTLQWHKSYVTSVAISKGAGIIASGSDDDTIKLWEIETGRLLNTLQGHEDHVTSVAISKGAGIIASGSVDKTIKLWEI
ncbi:MAG: pentapeptide repeat-containing protein, partial [bacterium]|nr:pentapeptide repeat-containing protein [bacterium]